MFFKKHFFVIIALLFSLTQSCTKTFNEKDLNSFNGVFLENNALSPLYKITHLENGLKKIVVHQGSPMWASGSVRYNFLKDAAIQIMMKECSGTMPKDYEHQQLGDSGWVHLSGFFKCSESAKKDKNINNYQNSNLTNKINSGNKELLLEQDEASNAIVLPIGVIGNYSESKKAIIYNKFLDIISNDYDLVSGEEYSKAEDEAFQQLDYNECTEDQCIRLIQELLQVEKVFKIELVKDNQDTQISLAYIDLDNKLVKTGFCEDCKTLELIGMINSLYQDLKEKR